ncbi:cell wall protein RTB1-like [Helianthus annuus]|uniref:cell wall protein RTB1-like n=1 Tax=Helianthus annuus TaxID=4232 RepID=UPI000B8F8FC4|nr:cell wall protein RTB1-like [Helianthus annuus]
MAKESKVSKAQVKGSEQTLDESTSAPQTSVTEPTTHDDHSTKTTAVKPPPSKSKKTKSKTKKPTKPTNKGPLEGEIPEMERSQPETLTPHVSSQKEHVVSTWTPPYESLPSLESMINSPSPRAFSLSTPLTSSPIPPTIIPLFEAIEIQTQNKPSHQHITESTPSTLAVSDPIQLANPQTTEEDTPLEFPEILVGSSSGAATTDVGSTDLHLDNSFISKTPLKATTTVSTKVTTGVFKLTSGVLSKVSSFEEESPQNQEQGASTNENFETPPVSKADTTTSGGISDDPI